VNWLKKLYQMYREYREKRKQRKRAKQVAKKIVEKQPILIDAFDVRRIRFQKMIAYHTNHFSRPFYGGYNQGTANMINKLPKLEGKGVLRFNPRVKPGPQMNVV